MKLKFQYNPLSLGLVLYLAFTMSCTHDNPLPKSAYEKADPNIGGIMYDRFWATESGFSQTDPNIEVFNSNANFFRCKQCHAWDGLGTAGSYINRAPSATRPNVAELNLYESVKLMSETELFEMMKKSEGRRDIDADLSAEGDKMPDYTQILSNKQIWDIVKFLKEGMVDVSELYSASYSGSYPTGIAVYNNIGLDGDADMGKAYYAANCASCHGDDGRLFPIEDKSVGQFLRAKPYEVHHKTKYGALGTEMVGDFELTLEDTKNLYRALANSTDFPDQGAIGPVYFSTDIEPIFYTAEKCTYCHQPGGIGSKYNLLEGVAYGTIDSNGFVDLANPEASKIYAVPSGGHLANYSAAERALVLAWIEQGALDN